MVSGLMIIVEHKTCARLGDSKQEKPLEVIKLGDIKFMLTREVSCSRRFLEKSAAIVRVRNQLYILVGAFVVCITFPNIFKSKHVYFQFNVVVSWTLPQLANPSASSKISVTFERFGNVIPVFERL